MPTFFFPIAPTTPPSGGGGAGLLPSPVPSQETPLNQENVPNAHIQTKAFVNMVRLFLRDYRELNRLIDGVEHSDRQIVWAILDTLDDFNTTPPFTGNSVTDFPSKHVLLRGVAASLLESLGVLQTRNHLQFSDGGLQVGVNDKTEYLQRWVQLFRSQYEEKKMKIKIAMNIERAWGGGLASEYRFVNNFYGEW